MKELFTLGLTETPSNFKVTKRPSIRGIIMKNEKVLLIHSTKYGYYKFPGGGIEKNENHLETLAREIKEETGFTLLPDSVKEYGLATIRHEDEYEKNAVFEQENFYYLCEISAECSEQNLDDYEAEEGFTPVWMDPFLAAHANANVASDEVSPYLLKREETILKLLTKELRIKKRKEHEKATLTALGKEEYADMLAYVQSILESDISENIGAKTDISYSRFEHTKRVLSWGKKLYDTCENPSAIHYDELIIATIFHDVGRTMSLKTHNPHAKESVPITREYLLSHGYSPQKTEYICYLVGSHSNKAEMKNPEIDPTLLMLLEADLLDDTGAQSLVMDCMITESRNPNATFIDCYDHIYNYTKRIHEKNPMVTAVARQIWEDKTKLVEDFCKSLEQDLVF